MSRTRSGANYSVVDVPRIIMPEDPMEDSDGDGQGQGEPGIKREPGTGPDYDCQQEEIESLKAKNREAEVLLRDTSAELTRAKQEMAGMEAEIEVLRRRGTAGTTTESSGYDVGVVDHTLKGLVVKMFDKNNLIRRLECYANDLNIKMKYMADAMAHVRTARVKTDDEITRDKAEMTVATDKLSMDGVDTDGSTSFDEFMATFRRVAVIS